MTNDNTQHAIINALNEFESYGLDTINGGETLEQFRNHIFKHFDQLRGDINNAIDGEHEISENDFSDFVRTVETNSTGDNINLLDEIETTLHSFSPDIEHKKHRYLREHFRNSIRFHIASIIGGYVKNNVELFTNHDTDIFRFFDTINTESKSVQLIDIIGDTFENEKRELYYYANL